MKVEELFSNSLGVCHFHDAILDATGKSLSDEALREKFDMLPDSIQQIAFEWGLSDTVFRDRIVEELK